MRNFPIQIKFAATENCPGHMLVLTSQPAILGGVQ
jgi:hypothetical protein